jgi:hypothetical protein
VLGFIALTSQRIPPRWAYVYVGLFFLSALGNLASDLVYFAGNWLQPLLYIFPIQQGSWTISESGGVARDLAVAARIRRRRNRERNFRPRM